MLSEHTTRQEHPGLPPSGSSLNPAFWIHREASLPRHDRSHPWPLAINLVFSLLLSSDVCWEVGLKVATL